jgi:hypothetical protein
VPQGRLSPRNYAPHISDPDPPQKPMTPEELKEMSRKAGELMRAHGIKTK